jgi:hypothetical protein
MTAEAKHSGSIPTAPPIAPITVTTADLRAVGYCFAGVRPWFARHGFDWQAFIEQGISAERLRATGDALIEPVIRSAGLREAALHLGAGSSADAPDRLNPPPSPKDTTNGRE